MALDFHSPPWELDGVELTPWRRIVWRERWSAYTTEVDKRRQRDIQEAELRQMRNR